MTFFKIHDFYLNTVLQSLCLIYFSYSIFVRNSLKTGKGRKQQDIEMTNCLKCLEKKGDKLEFLPYVGDMTNLGSARIVKILIIHVYIKCACGQDNVDHVLLNVDGDY